MDATSTWPWRELSPTRLPCPVTESAFSFLGLGLLNHVTWKLYQGLLLGEEGKTSVGPALSLWEVLALTGGPGRVRNRSRRLGDALWRAAPAAPRCVMP